MNRYCSDVFNVCLRFLLKSGRSESAAQLMMYKFTGLGNCDTVFDGTNIGVENIADLKLTAVCNTNVSIH